jgi:outer membrane protein OmpA-like peptidoglycan-associated protein
VLKRWYQEGKFEQCKLNLKGDAQNLSNSIEENEIIIETLHEFNSDVIKPIYFESLNKIAALVNIYPKSSISITGHADSIGSHIYNLTLGKNRALKVEKYLTDNGVSPSKIIIKSNGESVLREKETGDISRVFNRYTTLTISLNIQGGTSLEGVSHD